MNVFDEIRKSQSPPEPRLQFEPVSGCPECHKTTATVMVGRQRVELCKEHQVYWLGALNPCSQQFGELEAAFHEREEQQLKDWAANDLDNFQKVEPWFLGQTARDTK